MDLSDRLQFLTFRTKRFEGLIHNDRRMNCIQCIIDNSECDIWKPMSLRIQNPEFFSLECIDLMVGDAVIQRFDTSFFLRRNDLVEQRRNGNLLLFILPVREYLLDRLYRVMSLEHLVFKIKLFFKGSCDYVSLHSCFTRSYSEEDQNEPRRNYAIPFIYTLTQRVLPSDRNIRRIEMRLKGLTNGYHLVDLDKESISEIKIVLNGIIQIHWDEDDIDMYCVECPNSTYIPFNLEEFDYDILTLRFHFSSAIHLDMFDRILLTIQLRDGISFSSSFVVQCDSLNFARFRDGRMNVGYSCGYGPITMPFRLVRRRRNAIFAPMNNTIIRRIPQLVIQRRIEDPEYVCPITLLRIEENELYYVCERCNQAFSAEVFRVWVEQNHSCPTCRDRSISTHTVYWNSSPNSNEPTTLR